MNKEQAAFFESLGCLVAVLVCGGLLMIVWAVIGAQP